MIYLPKTIPSKVLVSSLLVLIAFSALAELTQAKRARPSGLSYLTGRDVKMRRGGCASFGHSCFGGHGKRAMPVKSSGDPEEIPEGIQHPAGVFLPEGILPESEVFSRDEGQLDEDGLDLFLKQEKYRQQNELGKLMSVIRKLVNREEEVPAEE